MKVLPQYLRNQVSMFDNSLLPKSSTTPFNLERETFSHQTNTLRYYLREFRRWYNRFCINLVAGNLETDLAVISPVWSRNGITCYP